MPRHFLAIMTACLGTMCSPLIMFSIDAADSPRGRVLIIGMDGTRADAVARATTPHLDQLMKQGAFTDTAQILGTRYDKNQTISGPGWSSILTGVWADKHGVHNNTFKGCNYELFPHFFKRLKSVYPDAQTVSLVSWEPIHKYILSEADIAKTEALPREKGEVVDLRSTADSLQIDTRDGKWHHLLASRQDGTVKLFLDGKLVSQTDAVNDGFDLSGDFYFLGRDTRSGPIGFEGDIDDVRIWQRALSDEEIASEAKAMPIKNRNGLLVEYLFDMENTTSDGNQHIYRDTGGTQDGPHNAIPVAGRSTTKTASATGQPVSSVLNVSPDGAVAGAKLPVSETLKKVSQSDFTIEARFRTTNPGRNVLMGNYGKSAGALNLELHENNSVRVYLQPQQLKKSNALQRENKRDEVMAKNAVKILQEEDPTAMFVYFHQVDATGHGIGFSPEVPEYVQAIENVDGHIGTILQGLHSRKNYQQENWLVIVCTDHGGYLKGHGNGHDKPEIRQVFMIVSGPAAKVGKIEKQAYLVDVAGTALTHLIGSIDQQWQLDGKAVGLK